jgi:hypothetical protein
VNRLPGSEEVGPIQVAKSLVGTDLSLRDLHAVEPNREDPRSIGSHLSVLIYGQTDLFPHLRLVAILAALREDRNEGERIALNGFPDLGLPSIPGEQTVDVTPDRYPCLGQHTLQLVDKVAVLADVGDECMRLARR